MGVLIALAQGIVTTRDIRFMLEVPSHLSWESRVHLVPAHALYLREVGYSDEDRRTFRSSSQL